MLTPATFKKNFFPRRCPPELLALLKFQNQSDEYFCGGFELTTNFGALETYSITDKTKEVIPFARNRSGSEFAFWISTQEKTFENAPIIFLDSEGIKNLVIATHVKEFLGLLALDHADPAVWLSPDIAFHMYASSPRAAQYKTWLIEHDIPMVSNPEPILIRAAKVFPGFQEWLRPDTVVPSGRPKPNNLKQACDWGTDEEVAQLLPNILNHSSEVLEALGAAIFRDRASIVSLFLDRGISVNQRLDYGESLLGCAARYLCVKTARLLISRGALSGNKNEFDETPLDRARASEMQTPGAADRKAELIVLLENRSK